MSAEVLRRAAALMRERAEAATGSQWDAEEEEVWCQEADGQPVPIARRAALADAEHIASWHPAVALAVADWLDASAAYHEEYPGYVHDGEDYAATIARAYLGESA